MSAPGEEIIPVEPGKLPAVVTYLERDLETLPPRTPASVSLEIPTPMATTRYIDLFKAIGMEWLWTSRLYWPEEKLDATLRSPSTDLSILKLKGTDAGMAELDLGHLPDIEITFFGLSPKATGKGLGGWLMTETLHRARELGGKRAWLHTCTLDHPAALPFYLKQGFSAFRREIDIVDDPRLTGIVPRDTALARHPVIGR